MAGYRHGRSECGVADPQRLTLGRVYVPWIAVCRHGAYHATPANAQKAFPHRSAVAFVRSHCTVLLLCAGVGRRLESLRPDSLVGQTAACRIGGLALHDSIVAYSRHYGRERQVHLLQQVVLMPLFGHVLLGTRCLLGNHRIHLRQHHGHEHTAVHGNHDRLYLYAG